MPSLEFLERLVESRSALLIILLAAVVWLARENRRLNRQNEALAARLVRFLELINGVPAGNAARHVTEPSPSPPENNRDSGLG